MRGDARVGKSPGNRQAVYEWRADAWVGCLQHQLERTRQLQEPAEIVQDHGGRLPSAQRARLRDMRDYYGFMVRELERPPAEYTGRFGER
ncbi:hypothetical protein [Streptomyces sp. NPDC048419]|uniref:hypothetical protein n=1 Tax=Streptomyces sp. NPDC048419 TaxID=3365547 RepID=UPI003721F6E4